MPAAVHLLPDEVYTWHLLLKTQKSKEDVSFLMRWREIRVSVQVWEVGQNWCVPLLDPSLSPLRGVFPSFMSQQPHEKPSSRPGALPHSNIPAPGDISLGSCSLPALGWLIPDPCAQDTGAGGPGGDPAPPGHHLRSCAPPPARPAPSPPPPPPHPAS